MIAREGMFESVPTVGLGQAAYTLANPLANGVSGAAHPAVQSPGLGAAAGLGAAFELKYHVDPDLAARVEHWAQSRLHPDSHGNNGRYTVTSVYCDTPALDVFHRSAGFRRVKFRLRRYDASPSAFLERKRKRGTQVLKRRTLVPAEQLPMLAATRTEAPWVGDWFHARVHRRSLRPTACVSYRRAAFFGMADEMPVRLTIDRDLIGVPVNHWQIPHLADGNALLPDGVLVELKFHLQAPALFRELMEILPVDLARVSKYRRCISACGIGGPALHPPAAGAH